mgnify:CR=1 FL=1
MNFDLSIIVVWLFLGLGLGVLSLLMILTLANTWSVIRPKTRQKRLLRAFDLGNILPAWVRRLSHSPLPFVDKHIESDQQDQPSGLLASHLPPLACDLDVRSTIVNTRCCLLHTRQGQPLHGGAVSTRLTRLRRMGVLI